MRSIALVIGLVLGCRKEAPTVRADPPVAVDAASDVHDVGLDTAPPKVVVPPPMHTDSRTRFATLSLTLAEHGVDGTLELWRDKRLDDKVVTAQWYHRFEDNLPKGFEKPAPAQLVLRDEGGKVLELIELGNPLVKLEPIRLGDEPVPYLEVSIDTYHGAHHWDGTTHRFARVEAGHLKWLECAACTDSALAGQHWFDPRPSGGNDLLWYRHGVATQTTILARTQVVAGTCRTTRKSVPGWLGDYGNPPAPKTSDFPPR